MDAILRAVQSDFEKAPAERLGALSVRLGMVADGTMSVTCEKKQAKAEMSMAKLIEFYIPARFRKNAKWIPPEQRGKIIEFPVETKKTA